MHLNSIIIGTGSYIPQKKVTNSDFFNSQFLRKNGEKFDKSNEEIVDKLHSISGIEERRYMEDDVDSSQIGAWAAEDTLKNIPLDREDLDGIIVAHNFGIIKSDNSHSHLIPNMAARIKNLLKIKNPKCFAYDILFGCPGWVQALIQAHQCIASGYAKHLLVIGVESMSRVIDPHDIDSMLFGDGAGAVVIKAEESKEKKGILAMQTYSHCEDEVEYLNMGASNNPCLKDSLFAKMNGKQVYRYSVSMLPVLVTECLENAGVSIKKVAKFLFHQANEKMNLAIGNALYKLHGLTADLNKAIPLTMHLLGNTSVATIPTLLDLIMKKKLPEHNINPGDIVVMASVGAGMHSNCIVYKF